MINVVKHWSWFPREVLDPFLNTFKQIGQCLEQHDQAEDIPAHCKAF